ncbi:MAG: BrnA antitoxin family protein [Rubrivivax sp.]
MNESKPGSAPWIDPDEAPDLSTQDPAHGAWRVGAKPVSPEEGLAAMGAARRGRPALPVKRPMLSMRVDVEVLARLRASGKGWQTRVNALLKEAVEKGRL